MTRKLARDMAFKILYQIEMQKETPENILEIQFDQEEITGNAKDYIYDIVLGIYKNINEINDKITTMSQSWNLDRISKISLSALRLSIYEILHRDDIPDTVSINEAVDIVKTYDSEESASFVNGVLASVLKSKKA